MGLSHIGVPRESHIVKKETEIFVVSSLLLSLKDIKVLVLKTVLAVDLKTFELLGC